METCGEAVFAARNAVEDIYENDAHGTGLTRAGASTAIRMPCWRLILAARLR